jgi:hypothetical protein
LLHQSFTRHISRINSLIALLLCSRLAIDPYFSPLSAVPANYLPYDFSFEISSYF